MANIMDKIQKLWNPPDDEYDEYYDEQPATTPAQTYAPQRENPAVQPAAPRRSVVSAATGTNRVVNINSKTRVQVVLFKPVSFGEETRTIADQLNQKNTVILNLEKTPKEESRRMLDFLSGVAYANDGKIKRVSTSTFIITPYNVEFSGDEVMDELENSGIYF